jgi:hypothetical protein
MGAGLYPARPVLARQHLVQAAELARTAQDQWCLADALQCIGYTHLAEGDHRLAAPFLEEAFPIWTAGETSSSGAGTTADWPGWPPREARCRPPRRRSGRQSR